MTPSHTAGYNNRLCAPTRLLVVQAGIIAATAGASSSQHTVADGASQEFPVVSETAVMNSASAQNL